MKADASLKKDLYTRPGNAQAARTKWTPLDVALNANLLLHKRDGPLAIVFTALALSSSFDSEIANSMPGPRVASKEYKYSKEHLDECEIRPFLYY